MKNSLNTSIGHEKGLKNQIIIGIDEDRSDCEGSKLCGDCNDRSHVYWNETHKKLLRILRRFSLVT